MTLVIESQKDSESPSERIILYTTEIVKRADFKL